MEHTSDHKNRTHGGIICIAGSRYGSVPEASMLVSALASQGVSFLVGCASGVDQSFVSTPDENFSFMADENCTLRPVNSVFSHLLRPLPLAEGLCRVQCDVSCGKSFP